MALRIPAFYSALAISEASDLILTAPTPLARLVPQGSALVSVPAPLALPEHGLQLMWHERFSSDPGQRWLREILSDVARSIDARRKPKPGGSPPDPSGAAATPPPRSPRARAARGG